MTATLVEAPQKPFREKRNGTESLSPLNVYLDILKITLLNRASVHEYMEHKVSRLKNPSFHGVTWIAILAFAFALGMLLLAASVAAFYFKTMGGPGAILGSLAGIACCCFALILRDYLPDPKKDATWRVMDFDSYLICRNSLSFSHAPVVPPQVMETAKRIQEEIPGARLMIHYLYIDPFLEIRLATSGHPEEKEFLEFWDEDFVLP
jgi:hypothetical protein